MHLLVFTTLFPWPAVPHHGVFVLERLKAWRRRHGGAATVVAPVPWIPKVLARGRYAQFRDVPDEEERDGFRVFHPRYTVLPKVGMNLAPGGLARAGARVYRQLRESGERFDLIDAHYLYPDGVAAGILAAEAELPLVVTARGTDVSLIPQFPGPRRKLERMLGKADAAIAVCKALADRMAPLHPPELPVRVLSNGVDLERFRPVDRDEARRSLGWADGPTVLSVGHLVERKGHHHLIEALPELPGVRLEIVGRGPMEGDLREQARRCGVADRVRLGGAMPHAELHRAYAAADVLALLSSREGWPNVVLEGLACGTSVVATEVWGTPEILKGTEGGTLLPSTEAGVVAAALRDHLEHPRSREVCREKAERHSWDQTADGMQELFAQVLETRSLA